MPKDVFQFSCPCCGKVIEVNVRSGKARAVKPKDAKGGQDLEKLLEAQRQEAERLGGAFDEARSDQAHSPEHLDDLFRKAKEDAKQDKDERPPSIWDLD